MILSVPNNEFERPIWSDDDPTGLDEHGMIHFLAIARGRVNSIDGAPHKLTGQENCELRGQDYLYSKQT
jgi:hypothetical protein